MKQTGMSHDRIEYAIEQTPRSHGRGLKSECAVAYSPVVAYPRLRGPVLSRHRHVACSSIRQECRTERPARRVGNIVSSPEAVERPRIRLARRHDIVRSELAVAVGLGLGSGTRNAQVARVGRCWRSSRRRRRPRRHTPRWWWRGLPRRRGRRARNGCFFRFLPLARCVATPFFLEARGSSTCFLVGSRSGCSCDWRRRRCSRRRRGPWGQWWRGRLGHEAAPVVRLAGGALPELRAGLL
jgi:hypothetical protein